MNKVGKSGEWYIHIYHNRYYVSKIVEGRQRQFGCFKTLDEAREHRDYCISKGWSSDCIKRINREYKKELRYIQKVPNSDKFRVCKNVNGVYKYFGTFNSLTEAQKHRDYCEMNNWSSDCVHLRRKKHNLPKYITRDRKNGFVVQKNNPKDSQWFRTLEDAVYERDLLIKAGWSDERLMELDEAEGSL